MRVYNEHEGFGVSFRDKIPHKGREEAKQIHEKINAVYGDVSPSYYQVKFWSKQFKWCRESIKDDSRSDQPVDASSKEMCQNVEDMILQDRHIKVSFIAHERGISAGSFQYHTFSLDDVKGQI